ncbi:hypothetical protein ACHAPU_000665 [Fusarium lateritium]
MTKPITLLLALFGTAVAQMSRTCVDIAFDSKTNVFSGRCQPRDNSGYLYSGLDLNNCFGYDGTQLTATYHGNFAKSCKNCETFIAPDPYYGGQIYWIKCDCTAGSSSIPIEEAVAHEYVSNKDGQILC